MTLYFSLFPGTPSGNGTEDWQRFIQLLNEQGYADVAVNYLNGFKENPATCPPELIEQLDLQIGIQTLEWLKTIRDPAQRATLMDQCQQCFVDFLAGNPNHESACEANSALARLLGEKGERLLKESEKEGISDAEKIARRTDAGKLFEDAKKYQDRAIALISEQINQISKDEKKQDSTEARRIYTSYINLNIQAAKFIADRARTWPEDSGERKNGLEAAQRLFHEIYSTYQQYPVSFTAQFYEAKIFQELKQNKEALAILDKLTLLPNDPSLYRLKTESLLMFCEISSERNQPEDQMEIIRRFYDWKNKGEFPKEYYTCMEGLQIHLLTGKAAIALEELRNTDSDQYKKTIQAVFIDKGDPGYKVIHNKQQLIPFAYETLDFIRQQQQNSLYGEVESLLKNPIFASLEEQKQKDVVTKNNDFETLYQNAGRCWSFYLQTRKDWEMASPENRAEAENRLSEAAQAADDSFRKALFFATPRAPASDVDKLRFQWASLCLLNKRYEDAIVLSEYLIQGNPDFEFLLETASVNLHAWYQIYNETKKESVSHTEIPEIIAHIQKCVDFMAERWGNEQAGNMSNLVQEALMIQIEMAIEEGRTQEAESLLSRIPENSLQRATAEMRLGRSLWNTYTILINQEIPPTADPENAASNGNPKKNDTDSPAVTNSANGVEEEPSSPTDKTAESEKEDNTSKTENLPESPENTGNSELANSKSTNPATEKTDSSETISDTPENREKLLMEAQKMLETGLTRKLTAGNVEPTDLQAIYSALSLAQIYMAQNDTENADKWMSHPVIGPYIRVNALLTSSGEETENATGTVLEPDFQMATMELMLRILVRQKKFDQAEQLMQTLESIADSGKESVRLTTVYLQLGKQIEEQVRSLSEAARRGDKAKQQELDDVFQGFETFLKRISVQEEGNTYQTLYWVADTFFCLAQGLGGNVSKPSPQVISYYESAGRTYQAILKKIELDPSWAPGFAETQTTIRLAECLRATNRFNNAVKILIPLLQKNSNLVEVQIEAAKTYQAWGLVNREYYLRAIQGAEPQADGQNLIWGWNGLISRLARSLNGNSPDKNQRTLNDMFYTACYNKSFCRYQYIRTIPNENEMKKQAAAGENELLRLYQLHPDLGGTIWFRKLETALKRFRKLQGEMDPAGFVSGPVKKK